MQTVEEFIKSSLAELLSSIQKARIEVEQYGATIPYGDFTVHFELDIVQSAERRNLVKGGSCGILGFVAEALKEDGDVASNQQTQRVAFDLPLKLTPPDRGFAPIGRPQNLRVC